MLHRRPSSETHPTARLVGQSAAIQALQAQIRRLTAFDTVDNPHAPTLLLQGETGTGKGLVARVIHDSGPRVQGPYIEVNCAAIPETMLEAELFGFEAGAFTDARRAKPGLFEAAAGGTLFLDEIDALPLGLQAKLLTALEEKRVRRLGAVTVRQVDVKIITATQAVLADRVAEGRFRADLYHRLTVVLLQLPPLRARGKDILVLAEYFLHRYAAAHRLSPKRLTRAAHEWLLAQAWPGNVRELSHLLERATLLHPGTVLDAPALEQLCLTQPSSPPERAADDPKPLDEAAQLQRALVQARGSVVGAARLLGLSRSAMRYRLQRYKIGLSDAPERPHATPEEAAGARTMDVPLREAEPRTPRSEQKPVALLAVALTLPPPSGRGTQVYEPWTIARRVERSMAEKVQGFGGVVLPGPPALHLVAFGLPRALEQMPHRAVQAALTLRHLVAEMAQTVGGALCPQVRCAVHLGEVLADTQMLPPHGDVLILGDALTLLMRLVGLAAPGDILLSPQVGRIVQDWFTLQSRGPLEEGEQPDQARAYAVLGLRSHHASPPGGLSVSRFVNRERELALFHELLTQAAQGRGQVVGLMGEPGVGKSRLLAEFRHQLSAGATSPGTHVRCLRGRCVAYGNTMPSLPIRELLRAYFALAEHADEETIRATLTATLRDLDASLLALIPAFLSLLDVPVDDGQWQSLEPLQRRQRLLDAAKRLLLYASQQQPLLIVVEDVHWIDETSQTFLDALVESLPAARILLLVSYRPEYHHSWGSKSFYTHLRLDPLKPEEARVFLTGLLGVEVTPASPLHALTQFLLEKAEGNPFFLEESVLTLRETQILVREHETYYLTQTLTTIQVPTTVQAVLAARIDRLPPEAKHLLQTAAVLGLEVSLPVLQAIAELAEDTLDRALAHVQQAEFLYETRLFPERVYAFKHPLMQEIAYRSLHEQERQRYHAAVGHSLETLATERLDGMVELLAHHFGRSREDDKAVEYAIRAAERAQRRWANSETLAYLEAAAARLAAMPDTPSNRLRRIDAVLKQGEARFALGQHAGHLAALESIRPLVEEASEPRYRVTWACWMGFFHIFAGSRPEVAIAYCQEASTIAAAEGFHDIRAMTDTCLAQAYVCAGDLQAAVAAGERALETFEARGYVWWACRTLWQLIQAANALGEWQRSLAYCRRALEYGQDVDDLRLKVVGWWRTGSTHIQRGDVEQGLQCCEAALALAPAPFDTAMIKAVRGHGWVKGGKEAAGTAELTAAVAWFERSRLGYTRAVFALRLGEAYLRQGEWLRARSLFQEVLTLSQEAGYRHLAGVAERFLGASLVGEDPAAAAAHVAGAVQSLEQMGARNEMAKGWVTQATLRHRVGDRAGARELLERALTLFERLGTLDEPCRVRAALATLQD